MRCIALGLAFLASASHAAGQTTTIGSVNSSGLSFASNNGGSAMGGLSGDARYVVFSSTSPFLAGSDTLGFDDVFVHDRFTGSTSRISAAPGGALGDGDSRQPSISDDGRHVVFKSLANNLVPLDLNAGSVTDVFVHDRVTGTTQLVNVDDQGVQGCCGANTSIFAPAISGDGRYVGFHTTAALEANDTNTTSDVYLRDLVAQTTELISFAIGGNAGNDSSYISALCISNDGRYVGFDSHATDLIAGDTNADPDIFVLDRQLGTMTRASLTSTGAQGFLNADTPPAISGDGHVVAWHSRYPFTPLANGGTMNVFVHDLLIGQTSLITLGMGGVPANGESWLAALSHDGRRIAFTSEATNLTGGGFGDYQVYHYDRATQLFTRVSVSTTGSIGNDDAPILPCSISDGGTVVAMVNTSTNLVANSGGGYQIFVHDLDEYVPVTAYCTPKINSLGCAPRISSAGVLHTSGADACFVTARGVRNNKLGLLFWGPTPAAIPFGGGTLCVQPPSVRTPTQDSSGNVGLDNCSGTYFFHFTQAYMIQKGVSAGDTLYGQYWSRDPGFAPPNNIGLTDGLSLFVGP